MKLVKTTLEKELGMDAKKASTRQEAIRWLPQIAKPADAGVPINLLTAIVGKTVESVEVGMEREFERRHQTEAAIIRFTDGSMIGITTASNAQNFNCEKHPPQKFQVDFRVQLVPPTQ